MPVTSKITQDLKLPDGRRSVCEEWTDDEGNTLYVSYACPEKTDIEAVKTARATSAQAQLTSIKSQVAEAKALEEAKLAEAPKEEPIKEIP